MVVQVHNTSFEDGRNSNDCETKESMAGMSMKVDRRIVCAAIRQSNGVVVCGARHYDMIMRDVIRSLMSTSPAEQGFIDNYGLFVDRCTAWQIANQAEQIRNRCGGDTANGGTLYSENLY